MLFCVRVFVCSCAKMEAERANEKLRAAQYCAEMNAAAEYDRVCQRIKENQELIAELRAQLVRHLDRLDDAAQEGSECYAEAVAKQGDVIEHIREQMHVLECEQKIAEETALKLKREKLGDA